MILSSTRSFAGREMNYYNRSERHKIQKEKTGSNSVGIWCDLLLVRRSLFEAYTRTT